MAARSEGAPGADATDGGRGRRGEPGVDDTEMDEVVAGVLAAPEGQRAHHEFERRLGLALSDMLRAAARWARLRVDPARIASLRGRVFEMLRLVDHGVAARERLARGMSARELLADIAADAVEAEKREQRRGAPPRRPRNTPPRNPRAHRGLRRRPRGAA